jgi:3-oxoacyl-[acyl-carrier protein] reductase
MSVISLNGRKALVTGSGRGIGREIALKLSAAGADVAVSDVDMETATQTSKEIGAQGRKSIALQADVSNSQSVAAMISAFLETFGTIDILINNAGITRDNLLIRMTEADWDLVLSVNLKSVFLCCKEAVRPMMKARYGRIINIASVVGLMGNVSQVNYAAAKAGMLGVTKSLAKEYSSKNITVNAVAPGFIKSAMTDKLSEEVRQKYIERIPLSRFGSPEDVANAVLFLVSPLADYITGQVLTVDGGLVM